MATFTFRYYGHGIINGQLVEIGDLDKPASVTSITQKDEVIVTIAASGTATLWNVDNSPLSDFDVMIIAADNDLALEFITDDDADVGEAIYTTEIRGSGVAGEYGMPFIFSKDDSIANHTVGFAGTWDVIERIEAKNRSSTTAVKVQLLALT